MHTYIHTIMYDQTLCSRGTFNVSTYIHSHTYIFSYIHVYNLLPYRTYAQENSRLKSQFTSQEEDRNFLIKQLVAVKKDNARLRAEYTEMEADYENCKKQLVSTTPNIYTYTHSLMKHC